MPLDLDPLLAPLQHTPPCGLDLSFSSEFDALQEMRREDDPTLSQGEWVTTLKVADWKGVVALGTSLLAERTKDLRVAAWTADASRRSSPLSACAISEADWMAMEMPSAMTGCASPATFPTLKTPPAWRGRMPGRIGPVASQEPSGSAPASASRTPRQEASRCASIASAARTDRPSRSAESRSRRMQHESDRRPRSAQTMPP